EVIARGRGGAVRYVDRFARTSQCETVIRGSAHGPRDSASASATSRTFSAPGCGAAVGNVFTVPAGVTGVKITATGSAGQTAASLPGGTGDVVSGTLTGPGLPAQLDVCVDWGGGLGGSRDGGSVGGAGGRASGVALGSDFLTPVVIAGGGGGGGYGGYTGGGAGMPKGGPGGGSDAQGAVGGGGGTPSSGGAAGAAEPYCYPDTCSAGQA